MLCFRLKNTLNFTQEQEWNLLAEKALGHGVHAGRKQGFLLARQALVEAFAQQGVTLQVQELELDHFDALKGYPEFTLSLAHSSAWGAAMVARKNQFISVGIDIELLERAVKPSVTQRISHVQDIKLEPIAQWSLKEACFKALMNTRRFEKNPEFSSILLGDKVWSHSSGLAGKWELEFTSELVVAKAWLEA